MTQLEADKRALVEALAPFAAACDQYVADWRSDDFAVPVYIKAGDLRNARATISNPSPVKGAE